MKKLTYISDLDLILACRVYLYKSFYLLFSKALDTDDISFLTSNEFKKTFEIAENIYNNIDYYNFVINLANNFGNSQFKNRLQKEYTELMIGPHKLVAPPWESVYRKKENVIFTEYTLQVRSEYQKYNLLPKEYPHVSDDHIMFELNYMLYLAGLLCEDEKDVNVIGDSLLFLENHLLQWINLYANQLNESESIYIKQIAWHLSSFLIADKKFLQQYFS
ncbi:TorD/DmsD family molecular chaperone [Sulfurospirillum multivorans]|uniref:Chaperone protein TorD n=2 Tax=Sulfurospirillum multivorans TaxID=66821 RepID=A0AA86DX39_SULMK|nr:molecular chaperone TorD family protein [Sulfurospirillum multivorans]AHJ11553.1 putative chaperone protein TorD [Sulfurospirillum multivorans DSM 12446]QEH05054.1 putative chaperone protein TorD [Sulfurospirillum multivorans]